MSIWGYTKYTASFHNKFQPVDGMEDFWLDKEGAGYLSARKDVREYYVGINAGTARDQSVTFRYSTNGVITAIISQLLLEGEDGTTNTATYIDRNADGIPERRYVPGMGYQAFYLGEFYPLKSTNSNQVPAQNEDDSALIFQIEVNNEWIDIELNGFKWKKRP